MKEVEEVKEDNRVSIDALINEIEELKEDSRVTIDVLIKEIQLIQQQIQTLSLRNKVRESKNKDNDNSGDDDDGDKKEIPITEPLKNESLQVQG